MKLDWLCPPFWRDNQSLNIFICFFWRTLFCDTQPEAFHALRDVLRATKGGSLLLPFSSESWLILRAITSQLCFVCSLLRQSLGCSSCCSALLPLWVTCHRHQVTTREPATPRRNSAFYPQLWKCSREGLSPCCRGSSTSTLSHCTQPPQCKAEFVVLLLHIEDLRFALPSVFLLTTHFQSLLVLISFPSGISLI